MSCGDIFTFLHICSYSHVHCGVYYYSPSFYLLFQCTLCLLDIHAFQSSRSCPSIFLFSSAKSWGNLRVKTKLASNLELRWLNSNFSSRKLFFQFHLTLEVCKLYFLFDFKISWEHKLFLFKCLMSQVTHPVNWKILSNKMCSVIYAKFYERRKALSPNIP